MTNEERYFSAAAEFSDERSRLELLEATFDPFSTRHLASLGVQDGWRCLEVAAGAGSIARWLAERVGERGRVVATDVDTRFLHDLPPWVDVREHDLVADDLECDAYDLECDAYDLVHSRDLLIHLANPIPALHKLVTAVKPAGWLLIENEDTNSMRAVDPSHPLAASFDHVMRVKSSVLRDEGFIDVSFAGAAPAVLDELGLEEVGNEASLCVVRGGEPYARFVAMSAQRVDGVVVGRAGTSGAHIEDQHRALADPTFSFFSAMLVSTWGRRPTAD